METITGRKNFHSIGKNFHSIGKNFHSIGKVSLVQGLFVSPEVPLADIECVGEKKMYEKIICQIRGIMVISTSEANPAQTQYLKGFEPFRLYSVLGPILRCENFFCGLSSWVSCSYKTEGFGGRIPVVESGAFAQHPRN